MQRAGESMDEGGKEGARGWGRRLLNSCSFMRTQCWWQEIKTNWEKMEVLKVEEWGQCCVEIGDRKLGKNGAEK